MRGRIVKEEDYKLKRDTAVILRSKGLTQREIAQTLGVSHSYVYRLLNSTREEHKEDLERRAEEKRQRYEEENKPKIKFQPEETQLDRIEEKLDLILKKVRRGRIF